MELTLQDLEKLIEQKNERISKITEELVKIGETIEDLATTDSDQTIEQILQDAVSLAAKRQELATKEEVLEKALTVARKELADLLSHQTQLETLDYLRRLRETGERCNETLEILKNQFKEIRKISAKLSTLPIKRAPLTHNYRANLPKLKILETVIVIEEDLRSGLDSINWNN